MEGTKAVPGHHIANDKAVPGSSGLLVHLSFDFRIEVEKEQRNGFQDARRRLNLASQSLEELGKKREDQVIRNIGHKIETYAGIAQSFLENYNGLTEIAKGVDNQYGGIATGILLVALAVPARKRAKEMKIEGLLKVLGDWVGRAENLDRMVKGAKEREPVKKWTREVCRLTTQLADEIYQYYNRGTLFRIKKVAVDNPESKLNRVAEEIKIAMREMMEESFVDALRSLKDIEARTKTIQTTTDTIQTTTETIKTRTETIETTNASIKAANDREEKQREKHITDELQRNLSIRERFNASEYARTFLAELERYCKPKPSPRKRTRSAWQLEQVSLGLLDANEIYAKWKNSERSGLLLLIGRDNAHVQTNSHGECWLSPATPSLFLDVKKRDGTAAFYSLSKLKRQHDSGDEVALEMELWSHLIFQILLWSEPFYNDNKHMVITESAHFKSLDSAEKTQEALTKTRALLKKLLERWAEFAEEKQSFIIIDRVDECSRRLVLHLWQITQIKGLSLKILTTGAHWKCGSWNFDTLEANNMLEESKDSFFTAEMSQRQLRS
ncbi:hypothetical protein NA57DRAFT_60053 [Rhizodiscina lignyota]|uniref:Uncharacterized protein n=1 Tax=Rhizodiscina lignyota TaxID=1504668 RepID=A0A9P4M6Z3_9PEZI|nr:hypothetical protein NA57DRAFT_60053 [Rhizodiscina lignyota]